MNDLLTPELEKKIANDTSEIINKLSQTIIKEEGKKWIDYSWAPKAKILIGQINRLRAMWLTWNESDKINNLWSEDSSISKIANELKQQHRQIMIEFLNFQKNILDYTGQEMKIYYVAGTTGKRAIKEVIDFDLTQRTRARTKDIYYQMRNIQYELKNIEDFQNTEASRLQKVASEVTKRFLDTRKKRNIGWQEGNRRERGIVYWRRGKKYSGYALSTIGPINEAFVSFYLNATKELSGQIETAIKEYVTDKENGVIKADNRSGFFFGDVEDQDGLQVQVKSAGARLLNMTQVLNNLDSLSLCVQQGPQAVRQYFEQGFTDEKAKDKTSQYSLLKPEEVEDILKQIKII